MKLFQKIRNFFFKKNSKINSQQINLKKLQSIFKNRYHTFKLLLYSNNKALEAMSNMEIALQGEKAFDMNFIRSHITIISTNVYKMITHLNELSQNKYPELFDQFSTIQKCIKNIIEPLPGQYYGPLTVPFKEITSKLTHLVGPKAANLGEISQKLGIKTPSGFVITAAAYYKFMEYNDLFSEIQRRIQLCKSSTLDKLYELSSSIQQLIIKSDIPYDLCQEILNKYKLLKNDLGKEVNVALRSSATNEDLYNASFAGQFKSTLNVRKEHLLHGYKEVIASKYTLQSMSYRQKKGIRDEDVAVCVICMPMIDAISGGVMYSKDPINPDSNNVIINSVWGIPKAVVDGSTPCDFFVINKKKPINIITKKIARKTYRFSPNIVEGLVREELPHHKGNEPSITDTEAIKLAKIAIQLEQYFNCPQDIEWIIDKNNEIVILQTRPLLCLQKEDEKISNLHLPPKNDIILEGGISIVKRISAGTVFKATQHVDLLRFPKGGVLVTSQALPLWAPLLSRANAIITEHGSITGHLATIARELKVPAIFGMAGAMEVLKDQMEVTVDANNCKIYSGIKKEILTNQTHSKNIMENTPVHSCLKNVCNYIIPLYLTDPESVYFKPKYCKTLHDITRFCHEKAVHHMFQFGKEQSYPIGSAKQLYYKGPMQFWIINLDDGFKENVIDKWIRIDNICSIPMLAIWEGMVFIPWEGPPPIDSKGFMSVLFEATTNPRLESAMPISYNIKNYFMISKHFCTLQSRFGFHFSTIEALVGNRDLENYVIFQFKGGAADFTRRIARIKFIENILKQYGFRTQITGDTLIARIEAYNKETMIQKLKILGYIIIHTRQLDMIMGNGNLFLKYKEKILSDLNRLVSKKGAIDNPE